MLSQGQMSQADALRDPGQPKGNILRERVNQKDSHPKERTNLITHGGFPPPNFNTGFRTEVILLIWSKNSLGLGGQVLVIYQSNWQKQSKWKFPVVESSINSGFKEFPFAACLECELTTTTTKRRTPSMEISHLGQGYVKELTT